VNDYWVVLLALASIVAIACGLMLAAWLRGRLGLASIGLFVLAVVAWVADAAAVTSGVGDADGFTDCRDSCTIAHRLGALGFIGPPLLISIAAAGMAIALIARARDRRGALDVGENRG
jgi:hypothetical protein